MSGDMTKHAMRAVLEDMGRAAREGRARRFTGPSKKKPAVNLEIGEITDLAPVDQPSEDQRMRIQQMDPEEEAELLSSLEIQR